MNTSRRTGMIAGAFVGVVAAVANWEGKIIVALSSVLVASAIGWTIGYYVGKRRSS